MARGKLRVSEDKLLAVRDELQVARDELQVVLDEQCIKANIIKPSHPRGF